MSLGAVDRCRARNSAPRAGSRPNRGPCVDPAESGLIRPSSGAAGARLGPSATPGLRLWPTFVPARPRPCGAVRIYSCRSRSPSTKRHRPSRSRRLSGPRGIHPRPDATPGLPPENETRPALNGAGGPARHPGRRVGARAGSSLPRRPETEDAKGPPCIGFVPRSLTPRRRNRRMVTERTRSRGSA